MPFPHLKERVRKDGWLYLALAGCILLCLILGMTEGSSTQTAEEARLARVMWRWRSSIRKRLPCPAAQ